MYTLLKPLLVREELLEKRVRIFTPLEFSRIFQASSHTIKYFLETQVKAGLLMRLKQGLYALKTNPPDEREVANRLYQPSYISFSYALAYYGILYEMPYTITSATVKSTRIFDSPTVPFAYFKIKQEAFAGYILKQDGNRSFLIAEPEKALVDYVYFAILGRGPSVDRLNLSLLNKDKAVEYAMLYGRKSLVKKIRDLFKSPPEVEII